MKNNNDYSITGKNISRPGSIQRVARPTVFPQGFHNNKIAAGSH
jgi:hypothetical protein